MTLPRLSHDNRALPFPVRLGLAVIADARTLAAAARAALVGR